MADSKTTVQIRKMLKASKTKLDEDIRYAAQAGVTLRADIESYRRGAIWALEWVLGKHGD